MQYIVGVKTPTLFREETLHVVHHGCEVACTFSRGNAIFLHIVHHGCDCTYSVLKQVWVWAYPRCRGSIFTEMPK